MINVIEGQKIPLSLQVFDGNTQLEVVAYLFIGGDLFLKQKLNHVSKGLYSSNDVEMPFCEYMIAQYETSEPKQYALAQDSFKFIPKVQQAEKYLLGEVIDTVQLSEHDGFLIGEVVDDN